MSSQVKKFYWHKFIHFYNNQEVTETQLGVFVTTKYMTYLSNQKDLFLTKQVSRCKTKQCHIIDIYANTNKLSRNKRVSTDWLVLRNRTYSIPKISINQIIFKLFLKWHQRIAFFNATRQRVPQSCSTYFQTEFSYIKATIRHIEINWASSFMMVNNSIAYKVVGENIRGITEKIIIRENTNNIIIYTINIQ